MPARNESSAAVPRDEPRTHRAPRAPGDRPTGARTAAFPGSFDPPTHAHLAIATQARRVADVERVDFVLSVRALGKDQRARPSVEQRRAVLERVARDRPWLGVVVAERALISEIAQGYDAVVMGADKWQQVCDPVWYGSTSARDHALAQLPRVLVVPRAGITVAGAETLEIETLEIETLEIDPIHRHTSSTQARAGATSLVLPEAREAPTCDA